MKRQKNKCLIKGNMPKYSIFTLLLLFTSAQYVYSQKHVIFNGISINGKVDKVKKRFEKKGWEHLMQFSGFNNIISSTGEFPPDYIVTSLDIFFSSKSKTVSSLLFVMRDKEQEKLYDKMINKFDSLYTESCIRFRDSVAIYFIKGYKNKDIGMVMIKKMENKIDLAIMVVDFKNHYKAIREGGTYLEEFYFYWPVVFL